MFLSTPANAMWAGICGVGVPTQIQRPPASTHNSILFNSRGYQEETHRTSGGLTGHTLTIRSKTAAAAASVHKVHCIGSNDTVG